jgi:hypothetical protein
VAWPGAGPRHLLVWAPGCSPRSLLLATFVFWWNMNFWVFCWNCWSLEIWYLDGPFSSRILTPAASSPIIIKHVKTEETNISIISKYEIYQWITVNYDIK